MVATWFSSVGVAMVLCMWGVHYSGKPVEVEEGDILTFHFSNFTQNSQFVYILCLEETGIIKFGAALKFFLRS